MIYTFIQGEEPIAMRYALERDY